MESVDSKLIGGIMCLGCWESESELGIIVHYSVPSVSSSEDSCPMGILSDCFRDVYVGRKLYELTLSCYSCPTFMQSSGCCWVCREKGSLRADFASDHENMIIATVIMIWHISNSFCADFTSSWVNNIIFFYASLFYSSQASCFIGG